jgi:hypothetical protein
LILWTCFNIPFPFCSSMVALFLVIVEVVWCNVTNRIQIKIHDWKPVDCIFFILNVLFCLLWCCKDCVVLWCLAFNTLMSFTKDIVLLFFILFYSLIKISETAFCKIAPSTQYCIYHVYGGMRYLIICL